MLCQVKNLFKLSVLFAIILNASYYVIGIKVLKSTLKLSEDGTAISGAKLIEDRKVKFKDISLCIRFNFKLLGVREGRSTLINVGDWRSSPLDKNFPLFWFGAYYPNSFLGFGHPRGEDSYQSYLLRDPESGEFGVWSTDKWTHTCFSFDHDSCFVRVVKDGKVMNVNHTDPRLRKVEVPDDFLSKIYLARCNLDYKNTCSTPEGQITDFNVWDKALTEQEAIDWTNCKNLEKGNIVNWDTATLETVNMTTTEKTIESICTPTRPGHVMFPEMRNFSEHLSICKKVRGIPSVIKSNETMQELISEFGRHPACGNILDVGEGTFWAGWWDKNSEGDFEDVNTSEKLTKDKFQPWYYGEPNGDILENCAVVWSTRNAWNDITCDFQTCSFCELEAVPDIQIRGLCYETDFDNKFSWTRELINGRHSFRGYTDSILYWDAGNNNWMLASYTNNDVYAICNTYEYPFGIHKWLIFNDTCYGNSSATVFLSFNTCTDIEFNCDDGNCVDQSKRCNGRVDCPDRSDEINCELFHIDDSYLKDVPPPSIKGDDSYSVQVFIAIDILEILDISEVENFISLQIQLNMAWKDKRLTMLNLKEDKDLNTLTSDLKNEIWIPVVEFQNTQSKLESKNDDKSFVTINRNNSYTISPKNRLRNAFIFQGSACPISISRVYNAEFICEFDMAVYPFDTQRCSVILAMKGNTGKFVQMMPDDLNYLGPIDLIQYFVKDSIMTQYETRQNTQAIKVDIIFGRRLLATILTTFLPTILICLVSFSTNYFKAFFFEAIVTVNLTALLVLTTLFISVSDSLPKTSYIKLIDIWLIFNLFIPFAEVLLHTFIDSLRKEDDREINHLGQKASDTKDRWKKLIQAKKSKIPDKGFEDSDLPRATPMGDLVSRNEEEEVEARKRFYEKARITDERQMMVATKIASKGLPFMYVSFIVAYFAIGMSYYNRGTKDL